MLQSSLIKKDTKNYSYLYFIIHFLMGVFFTIIFQNLFLLVVPAFLALVTIIFFPKDKKVIQIIIISTIFFYLIMLLSYYGWEMSTGLPYIGGGSDDLKFEEYGEVYALNNWFNFTANHGYSTNTRLYVTFIALLHKVTSFIGEYHTLIPRIFNGFFEIWIVIIVYKLMKCIFNIPVKSVYMGLYVLILNPYFKYINSFVFRDTLALLLFIYIIYLFFEMIMLKRREKINIILIVFLLFLSYYIRGQLLIISLASLSLIFLSEKKFKGNFICIITVISLSLIFDYLYNFIGYFDHLHAYIEFQSRNEGMTSKMVQIPLFPIGIILRYLYSFTVPWPDFYSLFNNSNLILKDILFLICYIYVIWQISNIVNIVRGAKSFKAIGWIFLLTLSMYSLTTLTFRHLIMVYPFFSMSYAKYHSIRHEFRTGNQYRFVLASVFLSMIIVYGLNK